MTTVVTAVAVAVVAVAAVGGYLLITRRRRVRRYRAWASANSWSYTTRDDGWLTAYPWGRGFGIGRRRHVIDVITGLYRGRPAACFTYRYTTTTPGPGPENSTSNNHYVAMHTLVLPGRVPYLHVGHRPLFWRTTPPGSRDFEAVFEVLTDQPDLVRGVLDHAMQQWVLDHAFAGFTMAGDRIFIAVGGRLKTERIGYWLDYLVALVDRMPARVWD